MLQVLTGSKIFTTAHHTPIIQVSFTFTRLFMALTPWKCYFLLVKQAERETERERKRARGQADLKETHKRLKETRREWVTSLSLLFLSSPLVFNRIMKRNVHCVTSAWAVTWSSLFVHCVCVCLSKASCYMNVQFAGEQTCIIPPHWHRTHSLLHQFVNHCLLLRKQLVIRTVLTEYFRVEVCYFTAI